MNYLVFSLSETGPNNNITFWRPQAPANYVILGDCVTSRYTFFSLCSNLFDFFFFSFRTHKNLSVELC